MIIIFLIRFIYFLIILIIFYYILLIIFIFLIYLLNKIWNLTWKNLEILLWIISFIFEFIRCLFLTVLLDITASMLNALTVWIFNILTWSLFDFINLQVIWEMGITASVTLFRFQLFTIFILGDWNLFKLIDFDIHWIYRLHFD